MRHRYSVNNGNLLIIKPSGKKNNLVADGDFRVNKDNQLEYWLNEPVSWRRIYGLPRKIVFTGSWRINKNYDLELILDKARNQFQGDILTIKGDIISTGADILAFQIKTYDRNGLLHIQILQLSVIWLADQANRLSFIVKKHTPDILTFGGDWQLNQNQQITYVYEKTELKTKTKVSRVLTFEGFWQINSANKLTYILRHSLDSKFDFRAQVETPSIYSQEGIIKYRLGVGVKQASRTKEKVVCLYGIWKFSRKLGLSFQVDYDNGVISKVEFAADVTFSRRNEVTFALKNKKGEPLGFNVIFTHKFLNSLNAEAFLRLKESWKEKRADLGVRIPF